MHWLDSLVTYLPLKGLALIDEDEGEFYRKIMLKMYAYVAIYVWIIFIFDDWLINSCGEWLLLL